MTAKETQMVQEALQYYPFENPTVLFIRHNENITCKVTVEGTDYVLRIHAPVEGFSLKLFEHGMAEELISGEIALLLHLSGTAPFLVQEPVKNRLGEYMTVLSDGTPVELLRWVDGKTLSGEDIAQCAGELGALAAQINAAAEGFAGKRISYSYDLVRRMRVEFMAAEEKAHLTKAQVFVCDEVLAEIERIMAELDGQPKSKCLIHADLSTENILRTPSGLAPIDFSLSGFGYRAQECGMLAFNCEREEEQEAVRTAYEAASGIMIAPHHMKAFGIFSILAFIAAQHDRYWKEEWFRKSMERWTSTLFIGLLND